MFYFLLELNSCYLFINIIKKKKKSSWCRGRGINKWSRSDGAFKSRLNEERICQGQGGTIYRYIS